MSGPQDTVGSPAGALPVVRVCVDSAFASSGKFSPQIFDSPDRCHHESCGGYLKEDADSEAGRVRLTGTTRRMSAVPQLQVATVTSSARLEVQYCTPRGYPFSMGRSVIRTGV